MSDFVNDYLLRIEPMILSILNKPNKTKLTYDILDTDDTIEYRLSCLRMKQYQMRIGDIWQMVFGSYNSFRDIREFTQYAYTGLDIMATK